MSTNIQNFPGDVQIRGTTFIKANSNTNNIAIGTNAGETIQGVNTVAMGYQAGRTTQGVSAVAVGNEAGQTSQGAYAVAVGVVAGQTSQGSNSVAVGNGAGQTSQGDFAVAMGYQAGETSQGANSIILNATGALLNSTTASSFHVKPVRGGNFAASALAYTSTGEIVEETGTTLMPLATSASGRRVQLTHSMCINLQVKPHLDYS